MGGSIFGSQFDAITGGHSGDDYKPESTGVQTQQQIQALIKNYPQLMQALNAQVSPTVNAQSSANLAAEQAVSPQEQALQAQLYGQNASQYANAASQAQTGANLNALNGAGGQSVLAGQKLQQEIDPEYYATRVAMGNKLQDLLNNPISGSESAAIERANNRGQINSGTYDVNNSGNAISAAMNFGQAGRDRLGQALQLATSAAPVMKSGADAFSQGTGAQGNTTGGQAANTAAGSTAASNIASQGLGQSAFGTAGNLMGQIGQTNMTQQNIMANRLTAANALTHTVAGY